LWIDLRVDADHLHDAAEGLRHDLTRFPHTLCDQAATSGAPSPRASVAAEP
jgi:hypothetical protein